MDFRKHTKERFVERFPSLGELTNEEYQYLHQLGCKKILNIGEDGNEIWPAYPRKKGGKRRAYRTVILFREKRICIVFTKKIVKTLYPENKRRIKRTNYYTEI